MPATKIVRQVRPTGEAFTLHPPTRHPNAVFREANAVPTIPMGTKGRTGSVKGGEYKLRLNNVNQGRIEIAGSANELPRQSVLRPTSGSLSRPQTRQRQLDHRTKSGTSLWHERHTPDDLLQRPPPRERDDRTGTRHRRSPTPVAPHP